LAGKWINAQWSSLRVAAAPNFDLGMFWGKAFPYTSERARCELHPIVRFLKKHSSTMHRKLETKVKH